jgi:hypothetical protein
MYSSRGNDRSGRGCMVVVVLIWQRMKLLDISIDRLAPKSQLPVGKRARVFINNGVLDDNCPFSNTLFAPIKSE